MHPTATSFAVLICAVVALGMRVTVEDQVQVQLYYETLCPDSIAFIVNQLYPTYRDLGKEHIALELIPYGFAKEHVDVNGTKSFTCQHGAQECYGNKAHACVDSLTDIDTTVDFVFCSESSRTPGDPDVLAECASSVNIAWTDLESCITEKGVELLEANRNKTVALSPSFVPTIVFDGSYSQDDQDDALEHFKEQICKRIGNTAEKC